MKVIQVLLLALAISSAALAEAQNIYTIQIASFTDLESAKRLAERVSRLLPITLSIKKSGDEYALRAGESSDKQGLAPYINTLKEAGYNSATLLYLPAAEGLTVLMIPPGVSKEPVSWEKRNPGVLKLSQAPQPAEIKAGGSKRESPEETVREEPEPDKKKGQTNLLDIKKREQQGTGAIKNPEQFRDADVPAKASRADAEQNLNRGWKGYKAERCNEAVEFFKQAGSHPGTSLEAGLGLAYCYIKLNEKERAISILEELLVKQYLVEQTLPVLLNLLIEQNQYGKANLHISKLGNRGKKEWEKKIKESKSRKPLHPSISNEFKKAEKSNDTAALISLTRKYQDRLNKCMEPGVFFKAGEMLNSQGRKDEAREIYYDLLAACLNKWDLRVGVLYELKSLLEYSEINKLIDAEMKRGGLPGDYKQRVNELKIDVLKERIAGISHDEEKITTLADAILLINPQDPDALLVKGWHSYNANNYEEAYEIFSKLHERDPSNGDFTIGLIYALIELNEEDEALGLLEQSSIETGEREKIENKIYLRRGNKLYEEENYAEAEAYIEKALVIDPENQGARTMLAWILYNRNKFNQALPLFIALFEKTRDSTIAEAILSTYDQLGKRKEAINFSYEIGRTSDESLKKAAGKYLAASGMPITASQIDSDPEAPYHNIDKPSFEFNPSYGHKSGDSGISELNDLAFPAVFSYPLKWGNDIRFSFAPHWLYSGDAPSSPFVGTAPDGGPKRRDLINSIRVFTPEISFEKEGYINYSARLGVTPLNGPVFPLPTFSFEAEQNRWRLNIHQESVKESILSYVGLEDPFGSREWGRVLKTGAEAELSLTPVPRYWFSIIGGYDYYWGNNVKGNNAVYGTVSAGRTFNKHEFDISLGLFFTSEHFERNSNFFTLGHGGYFSPEIFIMTGPTLGIVTRSYKSFWLSAQGTVGYLYFRTEDAPFLPLRNDKSDGEFKGETSSRIGFDINIETLKLLTPHIALGAFGDINRSADFTELSAGLTLRYYLFSRTGLAPSKSNDLWELR
ncbi:MAG: cellulose synthase subunit BcsC-related outer membrane protein [Deltaproteobacteria bacterium]